ncbi:MAG: 50S ribosomal protein L6 [Candidatus Aminicenantes bacterium]|nr:50S ribosomal protein L6 [Candidatus Aminicenantes bacterium]
MSRIGKQPILIPEGVKINIAADKIEFEGVKGKLTSPLLPGIKAKVEDNQLVIERTDETPKVRSFHGLNRTLAHNCCVGVSKGFEKKLEIVGVGYRAKLNKGQLELNIGYSKPVVYKVPEDIEIVVEKSTRIIVKGINKQRVGQEAYIIRSFRPPEPYKLKGIRYAGERLIKKERKAGVVGV